MKSSSFAPLRFALPALVAVWLWFAWKQGFIALLMDNPTAAFSYVGLFVLYLCTRPSWRELAAVVAAAIAIRIVTRNSAPLANDFLTLVATLGFGEHYFADLIVAVPYCLLLQALASERRTQYAAALIGLAGLLAWFVLLRFEIPVLENRPALLWTLSAAAVISGWIGLRVLERGSTTSAALREESNTGSTSPAPRTSN